jgi:hypothetical protein
VDADRAARNQRILEPHTQGLGVPTILRMLAADRLAWAYDTKATIWQIISCVRCQRRDGLLELSGK